MASAGILFARPADRECEVDARHQARAYQTLVRIFEADGFAFDWQRGDHLIYTKADVRRPLVTPMYAEVPVFIVKNLIRTASMSRERYFALLEQS